MLCERACVCFRFNYFSFSLWPRQVFNQLLGNPSFWAVISLCLTVVVMRDLTWKFYHRWWQPKLHHMILEAEAKGDGSPLQVTTKDWVAATARAGDETDGQAAFGSDGGSGGFRSSISVQSGIGGGSRRIWRSGRVRLRGSTPLVSAPREGFSYALGGSGIGPVEGSGRARSDSEGVSGRSSRRQDGDRRGNPVRSMFAMRRRRSFAWTAPTARELSFSEREAMPPSLQLGQSRTSPLSEQKVQLEQGEEDEGPGSIEVAVAAAEDGERKTDCGVEIKGEGAGSGSGGVEEVEMVSRPSCLYDSVETERESAPFASRSSLARSWSWVSLRCSGFGVRSAVRLSEGDPGAFVT